MKTSSQGTFQAWLCLAAATLWTTASSQISAQTPAFIPGDAFFVFLLNEKMLDAMPAQGGDVEIPYHVAAPPFGRLYTGFGKLLLKDVPQKAIQNIRWVYTAHRQHFPKITRADGVELNPPVAFLFNHDVDWKTVRIGLKFNEDWPNLPPAAFNGPDRGVGRKDQRTGASHYVPLVKRYEAVVYDWQNAQQINPLRVRVPENVAWGKGGEIIANPVVLSYAECQVVVTTEEDLEVYFLQLPLPDGPILFRLAGPEVSECFWEIDDDGETVMKCERRDRSEPLIEKRTRALAPSLYYGNVREGHRNGDITIPVWPDCRVPLGVPSSHYEIE